MTAPASVENPFAGQGSVLLDIGGDVGALIVTTAAEMEGVEVEIRPTSGQRREHADGEGHQHAAEDGHHHDHDGAHHPHVAVVLRPTPSGVVPSLVYPDLVEGSYELYVKGTTDVRLTTDVVGGQVAEVVWPG